VHPKERDSSIYHSRLFTKDTYALHTLLQGVDQNLQPRHGHELRFPSTPQGAFLSMH